MICKHCGSQLSGNVCSSCKMTASLSYTSHELADLLGIRITNNHGLNEDQLQSAYNSGFDAGQKRGFDSAQKESANAIKRQQRFFIIVAASGAVVLTLFSSIVTGAIRYNTGYRNGVIMGKYEQERVDKSRISESYQQGYNAGYDKGYQVGYEHGLLVTPISIPNSEPTPTPTPYSFELKMKSKGDKVRQLQQRLISLGYLAENEADGDFGPKTEKAVKQFQSNNGTNPTGIVDQDLWDLIMSDDAIAVTPEIQLTAPSQLIEPAEATTSGIGAGEAAEDSTQPNPMDSKPVIETDEIDVVT